MPIYPFNCRNCNKRFSVTQSYEEYGQREVTCPHCSSHDTARRLARVRFARSEESRMDALADPAALAGLEDDPKAMGKMMRQMSNEFGDDMGDSGSDAEFNEVIDRLESGQSPEQIEKDLPALGGVEDSPL
ncbi:MAG: zinc ribbon domain-containing protein [Chloroflexi bacterium]|nr:zinc ribbon domain-containing protein [Chloroflexota bacterium]